MTDLERWIESAGLAVGVVPLSGWPWMSDVLPILATRPSVPPSSEIWRIDEAGGLSDHPDSWPSGAAVFQCDLSQVPLFTLWRLKRLGCDRFFFPAKVRWVQRNPMSALRAAYFRSAARSGASLLPGPFVRALLGDVSAEKAFVEWGRLGSQDFESGSLTWTEFIDFSNRQMLAEPSRSRTPPRVALYIGSLGPGGAERQFCNLANRLASRGQDVITIVAHRMSDATAHYVGLLKDTRIQPLVADEAACDEEVDGDLLLATPPELRNAILRLVGVLRRTRPDVLHAWLDQCNIIGGIAALLAGVPRILLSTRNSNPTNFPRLLAPYMEGWYRILASSHRVRILANSRSGASSYADWIGIPPRHIHVVLNGFDETDFESVTPADRAAVRAEIGVPPDATVLSGVFRLDQEKQPDLFLEVVRRALGQVQDLRVLIAGTGPLRSEMEATVRRFGISDRVSFLGRRKDIARILSASDVLLLTSTLEGSPNAVIEASHFGVPVIATRGGGTSDAIIHGETGFLAGVSDADGLAAAVLRVLGDPGLRERMKTAGPRFIASAFSLDEMVDLTVEAYNRLFEDNPKEPTQVVSRRVKDFLLTDRDEITA